MVAGSEDRPLLGPQVERRFEEQGTYKDKAPGIPAKDGYNTYREKVEGYAAEGNRVLVLVHSDSPFTGETAVCLVMCRSLRSCSGQTGRKPKLWNILGTGCRHQGNLRITLYCVWR